MSARDPSLLYRPNPKQALVCNSDSKEIWVFGGNRAGKTENNIYEMKRMLDGTHPLRALKPRHDGARWMIWMVSEDGSIQRDVLQQKFDRFIPKEWKIKEVKHAEQYEFIILRFHNTKFNREMEAQITWKTYNSDPDTFESASVDLCVCDEEPPKVIYEAILARLFDAGAWGNGYFECALTPARGEGWTTTEVWDQRHKNTKRLVIQMSTYDNAENLGGIERVRDFESTLPEYARPARVYGLPFAREGAVVDKFINQLFPYGHILLPFKPDWNVCTPYEAVDWGYSSPMAVGFYAVYPGNWIVQYDELYVRNCSIPALKGLIFHKRRFYGYKKPRNTLIDPACRNKESNGKSKVDQFNSRERNVWVGQGIEPSESYMMNLRNMLNAGKLTHHMFDQRVKAYQAREGYISYPIPVSLAENKRNEGWDTLNSYYEIDKRTGRPNLFVTANCVETIRELVRLRWRKARNGEANDKNEVSGDDHSCDQQRYLTMARPQHVIGYNGNNTGGRRRVRDAQRDQYESSLISAII